MQCVVTFVMLIFVAGNLCGGPIFNILVSCDSPLNPSSFQPRKLDSTHAPIYMHNVTVLVA